MTNSIPTFTAADQINAWVTWAMNLGAAPFTVLAIITLGYVLRLIPIFPNKWIPVVCVVLGMIIFPCLAQRHASDAMVAFLIRTVFMGMIIGFGSWAFHDKIFSKVEDKVPLLKTIVAIADKDKPDNPPTQPNQEFNCPPKTAQFTPTQPTTKP